MGCRIGLPVKVKTDAAGLPVRFTWRSVDGPHLRYAQWSWAPAGRLWVLNVV